MRLQGRARAKNAVAHTVSGEAHDHRARVPFVAPLPQSMRSFQIVWGQGRPQRHRLVDHGQHLLLSVFAAASLCHTSEDEIGSPRILFGMIGLIFQFTDPTLELFDAGLALGQLSEQPIYLGSLLVQLISKNLGV